MSPIRVQALYTRYPHFGPYAGFYQVCRHLHSPHVEIALRAVRNSDEDWPLPHNPLNGHIRRYVSDRGMPWYKLSDLAAELRLLSDAVARRVDIVHYLDGEHTAQFLPGWARRLPRSRVRTIGTFHQPPELLPGLVSPRSAAALDRVLVMSPTQEAFFHDLLPPERVRTFLHGVDTDFFKPALEHDDRSGFRCITVGHWLRDWNAIREVIRRLSSEKEVEFHVVTGHETGLEGCANVVTHRNVVDEELLGLYQSADVLLLPLTSSTANNSLLEGLACGLPVISTRLESVKAYVGEGPAYLIEKNDPDALIGAIVELREDDVRRSAMGKAARARAEELAWPHRAVELTEIYRSLASQ